jgi:CheY-like chemotaxis protein/HPt (histidine-containing phosphotransfer) domain-containing protein
VPILVVDDNGTNRKILQKILRSWGARPTVASCAVDALDLLRNPPDDTPWALVILDYHMPDMDGIELARIIDEDPSIRPVPVVMLASALLQQGEVREHRFGIRSFLTKPVAQAVLHDRLSEILAPDAVRPLVARDADRRAGDASSGRILVAEDNAVNQRVTARILEKHGYRVDLVANGQEAVEAEARTAYDLLVIDCQMPVLDGYSATRAIRAREVGDRRLPIIALTAAVLAGEEERCFAAGMDAYLTKPVQAPDLVAAVRYWTAGGARPMGDRAPSTDAGAPVLGDVAPLDSAMVQGLRDLGGDELVFELVGLFHQELDRQLPELDAALADHDSVRLRQAAHAISGGSANIGAVRLAEAARILERLSDAGDLEAAEPVVTEIASLATATLGALHQVTGRAEPGVGALV